MRLVRYADAPDLQEIRYEVLSRVTFPEYLQNNQSLLGVNHFIMRVQWPGLEQAKALRTISTLGEIFA